MNFVDLFSLELHRAIADKMLRDEEVVLKKAKENIVRWLKNGNVSGEAGSPILEWKEILDRESPAYIRRLLTALTPDGQRLRSSSPFTGILSKRERDAIMKNCAEIEPI